MPKTNTITNKKLMLQYQNLARKLNRTPPKRAFEHNQLAIRRFQTWNNFVRKCNLKVNKKTPEQNKRKIYITEDELYQKYIIEEKSLIQLAEEYNCSASGIAYYIEKYELQQYNYKELFNMIEPFNNNRYRKLIKELYHIANNDKELINISNQNNKKAYNLYLKILRYAKKENLSIEEFCNKLGFTYKKLDNNLKSYPSKIVSNELTSVKLIKLIKEKTYAEIAEEYDCTISHIANLYKKYKEQKLISPGEQEKINQIKKERRGKK